MGNFIDLTGRKFGRLTVIERTANRNGKPHWFCRCECGKEVVVAGVNLRSGNTVSCGCYRNEQIGNVNATHRMFGTRVHRIWHHIKNRCLNKNAHNYKYYGGRGISICEEWLQFEPFLIWALSHGYTDNLTIDRKDVNGNYTPENCHWVSVKEQHYNKRNSRNLELNGENHPLAEWAKIIGVSYGTLYARLKTHSPADALTMKGRPRRSA